MSNSKSSVNISQSKAVQKPLPGFAMEVESERPGWRKYHITKLDGRFQVKYVKNG